MEELSQSLLEVLLKDQGQGTYLRWASPRFEHLGQAYRPSQQMSPDLLAGLDLSLLADNQPVLPHWLVKKQTNLTWSGLKDKSLQDLMGVTCLEPIVGRSSYLATTWGFLDRKLQALQQADLTEEDWFSLARSAYQASYAFGQSGPDILACRLQLLASFDTYFFQKFGKMAEPSRRLEIGTIISYNVWQMVSGGYTSPYSDRGRQVQQLDLFEEVAVKKQRPKKAKLMDWETQTKVTVQSWVKKDKPFDLVLANLMLCFQPSQYLARFVGWGQASSFLVPLAVFEKKRQDLPLKLVYQDYVHRLWPGRVSKDRLALIQINGPKET